MKIKNPGFALTAVIIAIFMMMVLASAVLLYAYNIRRLQDSLAGLRTLAYYNANAGIVDAQWRIRTNYQGNFDPGDPDPPSYTLDVNGDSLPDVTVDIGAFNSATRNRSISATGHE